MCKSEQNRANARRNIRSSGDFLPVILPYAHQPGLLMDRSDAPLREYDRRSRLQDELLLGACRRAEHRAHIDRELQRAGIAPPSTSPEPG